MQMKESVPGAAGDISVSVPASDGLFDVSQSQHRNPTNCQHDERIVGYEKNLQPKNDEKASPPLKTRTSAEFRMPEEIFGMTWLRDKRKPWGKR